MERRVERRAHFSAALNSYAHDQGSDGTCYAHSIASLIVDALRRLGVPSLPSRDDVLQAVISAARLAEPRPAKGEFAETWDGQG